MYNDLAEKLETLRAELKQGKAQLRDQITVDPVREKLESILEGSVAKKLPAKNLEEIYKEGKARYKQKIPPGYEDEKNKPEPDRYGDLVIWKSVMEHAKKQKKSVIFITDDVKEDWWRFALKNDRIGPRAELIAEFKEVASQSIWVYVSEEFLSRARKYQLADVSKDTVKEIKRAAKNRKAASLLTGLQYQEPFIQNVIAKIVADQKKHREEIFKSLSFKHLVKPMDLSGLITTPSLADLISLSQNEIDENSENDQDRTDEDSASDSDRDE